MIGNIIRRVFVLILCLCFLLTGCTNKQEEQKRLEEEKQQQELEQKQQEEEEKKKQEELEKQKQEEEYPDNLIYYDTSFDDTLTNRTFRYYVFVYSSTHTFYNETAIGPCDCVDGGFYVKDFEKKTIRQLVDLSVKVDYHNGNDNGIYFTSNNGLYKIDYIGKECQLIYQGTDLNSGFITYDGGYVYINDVRDFIVVDEATLEYEVIPNIGRSGSFYIDGNIMEYYDLDLENFYLLDLTTKEVTIKEGFN